jgi:site-specific DNA-cytosine methylase
LIRQVPLTNAFAARPTIAAKKNAETGEWTETRFCVNFIPQNKGTDTIMHALPLPEAIFRRFGKARFFSKLDMRSGFHQLVLDEDSQLRTAFWWGGELWCYTRLPFGLKNSSAIFQRVMDTVLTEAGLAGFASAFVDDVIVWSETAEEHVSHVRQVLCALEQQGLKAHPDKSIFMAEGVEYLGHVVSPAGLSPHAARVAAFKQLRLPVTKEELSSQLGVLGFYRCYLPGYSTIAEPLRKLRKQSAPSVLQWDAETRAAYQGLLDGLTRGDVVLHREDPDRPFILHTDWSTRGLGAILTQVDTEGEEHMVACISRSLNTHEARYPAWKGELLAVVWAVKHFKPYLAGRDFTICTDHRPLLWLMTAADLAGQQERWVLALQEFTFSVQHRDGSSNPADAPSRYPVTSNADPTGARLDEEGAVYRAVPRVVFASEEQRQKAIDEFIAGTSVAPAGAAAALVWSGVEEQQQPAVAAAAAHYQLRSYVCEACPPVAACVAAVAVVGAELVEEQRDQVERRVLAQQLQEWAAAVAKALGVAAVSQEAGLVQPPAGVVVVELFGGMCAGLEACLRNGWSVSRYIYVDCDAAVRRVARHRVQQLSLQYPEQLPASSVSNAFVFWPQDVAELSHSHLLQLQQLPGPVVLWAGWECNDLSVAGSGQGLAGPRSGTFFSLHKVLLGLHDLLGARLGYVLENVAMDVPWQRHQVVRADDQRLRQLLGEPLVLDAAQFGSRAHRLRYFWTNLGQQRQLQQVLSAAVRPAGRLVQDILEPGRSCRPVAHSDQAPFYVCNVVGQPRQALPTLVAKVRSHAFRGEGQGTIWDCRRKAWTEPTVLERELALGYGAGATAAAGASLVLRHQVLGRCMDANTVMAVLAAAQAVAGSHPWWGLAWEEKGVHVAPAAAAVVPENLPAMCAFALQAAAAAAVQQEGASSRDIWDDPAALQWLQHGAGGAGGLPRAERSRLAHRARLYVWKDGALWRRMPDGTQKLVPKPADRPGLIERLHEQAGHFGVRRTAHLVLASHWWRTLHVDVAAVVRKCGVCDRVRAAFNTQQAQLQSLPIREMFYRWGVDLAGEFPVTRRGHKWVMVAVEHFSKHVELIPLRDKTASETAAAFAQVLCRFGAPAEVVTDGGGEFQGEFDVLLSSCFIDHRVTSPHHPQANGLAERIVQVTKRGLRKLCESKGTAQWDDELPWVALGYRCSKQSSTGFSPYELLYARQPVFPSAVQPKLQGEVDFDDAEAAASSVLRRAAWLRERMPVAAGNLKAAQHRDTLRYLQLRSKGYLPRVASYQPGDFVYLRRLKAGSSLVIKARPTILRVAEMRDNGVVVLQDKAGQKFVQQVSQLAPCHLPDIDGSIDPVLLGQDMGAECEVCGSADDEAVFMFCDHCNTGWHTYCCTPPMAQVPEGHFLCERCTAAGVTLQQLQAAEQVRRVQAERGSAVDLFPLADQRRRDERAAGLHGRFITRRQGRAVVWGRVSFKGAQYRPAYFKLAFADGVVQDGLSHRMVTQGKAYSLQPEGRQPPANIQVPEAEQVQVL